MPPPTKAASTPDDAPGRLEPDTPRSAVQAAAALLVTYHSAFITRADQQVAPPLDDPTVRRIAQLWPVIEPRRPDDNDHRLCAYPTVHDPKTRIQLFCGCKAEAKKPYCQVHAALCFNGC